MSQRLKTLSMFDTHEVLFIDMRELGAMISRKEHEMLAATLSEQIQKANAWDEAIRLNLAKIAYTL